LNELSERSVEKGGPLVIRLPRAAGAREARWAHLLSGPIDVATLALSPQSDDFVATSEIAALKVQMASMQGELGMLRAMIERLYIELGVTRN
jgi:uncharacterized protein